MNRIARRLALVVLAVIALTGTASAKLTAQQEERLKDVTKSCAAMLNVDADKFLENPLPLEKAQDGFGVIVQMDDGLPKVSISHDLTGSMNRQPQLNIYFNGGDQLRDIFVQNLEKIAEIWGGKFDENTLHVGESAYEGSYMKATIYLRQPADLNASFLWALRKYEEISINARVSINFVNVPKETLRAYPYGFTLIHGHPELEKSQSEE